MPEIYTLSNEKLRVEISAAGAELRSAVSKADGCEYIWQGDPKYWEDRAPVLFPICGRFWEGHYTYRGREYEMGMHGFAAASRFEVRDVSDDAVTFVLKDSAATRAVYPFAFSLELSYRLAGDTLSCDVAITNKGEDVMPATFGGHPGFRVPFDGKAPFESFCLRFGERATPNKLLITPDGFYSGRQVALPLVGGDTLPLSHELFASDGIFMCRMPDTVTLCSEKDPHAVTLTYPGFHYLGIWQEYGKDTPFLCIEPWCGMAAYQGEHADLETKPDMFHLQSGEVKRLRYAIRFR